MPAARSCLYMNEQLFDRLLKSYLADTLTNEEKRQFFDMVNDPAYREQLDVGLETHWRDLMPLSQTALSGSSDRIANVLQRLETKRSKRFSYGYWLAAASVAAVLFLLLLNPSANHTVPMATSETYTITTLHGQKKKIRLPDSSLVVLNSGSTLSYQDDYHTARRTLRLSGEAFFSVSHSKDRPFEVYVGDVATTVLGTEFVVSAYENTRKIQVAVTSGRVRVGRQTDSTTEQAFARQVHAGELLTYDLATLRGKLTQPDDMEHWAGWKDEILVLHADETFGQAAERLERWYGVHVRFKDNRLKNARFKGKFKNLPLNEVLNILKKSTPFHYQILEDTVIIGSGGKDYSNNNINKRRNKSDEMN